MHPSSNRLFFLRDADFDPATSPGRFFSLIGRLGSIMAIMENKYALLDLTQAAYYGAGVPINEILTGIRAA